MQQLSKARATQKTEIVAKLYAEKDKVEALLADYNEAVIALNMATSDFNAVVMEANEFRQAVVDSQQEYFDNRSEKWQESDAADEYQSWIDSWNQELEEIDDEQFEECDSLDMDATIEVFEQMPDVKE